MSSNEDAGPFDPNVLAEVSVGGIVLEEVGQRVNVAEVVDSGNLDGVVVEREADDFAADPAKPVDTDLECLWHASSIPPRVRRKQENGGRISDMGLVNPAGGLYYHVRAWRYSRRLWEPFRASVARWLAEWSPPERVLLLVGPSGGYTLPMEWITGRFDRVVAVEPDPLARWIFERKFRQTADAQGQQVGVPGLEWRNEDLLSSHILNAFLGRGSGEGMAVLYSNILGQMGILGREFEEAKRIVSVLAASGCSWATYHDRFSSSGDGVVYDHGEIPAPEGALQGEAVWELRPGVRHTVEWLCARGRGRV